SKGFEIQVNNSHTDRARTGSLYHVQDILDDSPAKDDEWFTEDIVVKGDTITVSVKGKQVVQWTQTADWNGGREGPGRRIPGPGGLELYSVRGDLAKDLLGTVAAVGKIGYEVVEFYAPYLDWTTDTAKSVRKVLDDSGLKCHSTHNNGPSFTPDGLKKAIEL